MEFFLAIFVFIAVIAVTALLFSGWAIVAVIRAMVGALSRVGRSGSSPRPSPVAGPPSPIYEGPRCTQGRCLETNPPLSRFCRRCGAALVDSPRSLRL